jgi:hypothetical protein
VDTTIIQSKSKTEKLKKASSAVYASYLRKQLRKSVLGFVKQGKTKRKSNGS